MRVLSLVAISSLLAVILVAFPNDSGAEAQGNTEPTATCLTDPADPDSAPGPLHGRTRAVVDWILGRLSVNYASCGSVTTSQLNGIGGGMDLRGRGITSLQAHDFADLTSVISVILGAFPPGSSSRSATPNYLTSLPAGIFDDQDSVRWIHVLWSGLTEVPAGIFGSADPNRNVLPELLAIRLEDSEIESVHKDAFINLPKLQQIGLGVNNLTEIHKDTFNRIPTLVRLFFGGNRISSLHPDIFKGLSNLEQLSFHSNQISVLHPDIFKGLSKLWDLRFYFNQIQHLDKDIFADTTKVYRLYMQGNALRDLPQGIFDNLRPDGIIEVNGRTVNRRLRLLLHNNCLYNLPADRLNNIPELYSLFIYGNGFGNPPPSYFRGINGLEILLLGTTEVYENYRDPFRENTEIFKSETGIGRAPTDQELASYKAVLPDLATLQMAPDSEATGERLAIDKCKKDSRILRIEPAIESITIAVDDEVRLGVRVFGLQNERDDSLADAVSPDVISFEWSSDSEGVFEESATNNVRINGQADDRRALYVAVGDPGTYTVTAKLSEDECVGTEEQCSANFIVRVIRPWIPTPTPSPVPCHTTGDMPPAISDSRGNQYAVFSRDNGGTFKNEDSEISLPPGSMSDCDYIGVRMDSGGQSQNRRPELYRFTLSGNMYSATAVDPSGSPITDYEFDLPAEVCVPLPENLTGSIAEISLLKLNNDDSMTDLSSKVKVTSNGNPRVCGMLLQLPADISAGKRGAPDPTRVPMPTATPEPPVTGGTAVPYSWAWLIAILGAGIFVLGAATLTKRRDLSKTYSRRAE